MLRLLPLALTDLADRTVLRVLARSLALTLATFAALGAALWWGSDALIGAATGWRSGPLAALVAAAGTVLAGWLLFRAVAVAAIGLFADEMVAAVEARHYPAALASARVVPFARTLRMALGSAGRFVLVNLALVPAYLLLLATGVGTPALFLGANGWLLGRDLGDMAAARHLDPAAMRAWRAATGPARFALGLATTGLFVVPGVAFVAPVLGAAMATHLFHRARPVSKERP